MADRDRLTVDILKQETGITDEQLASKANIAVLRKVVKHFHCYEVYWGEPGLNLSRSQQADVKHCALRGGNEMAMVTALRLWSERNPYVSYRALVETLLELEEGVVADEVCKTVIRAVNTPISNIHLDQKKPGMTLTSPYVFKQTNIRRYKRENNAFYCKPFHSHPKGYKMCICVYIGGFGNGNGTHISIGAHLMKGKNDDSLSWPFTGTVTIDMLNQLEDKNHHRRSFTFPPAHCSGKRVLSDERAVHGYGRPKFILYSDLKHRQDQKFQYLKEDVLVFKVSIQVDDYKPWLENTRE